MVYSVYTNSEVLKNREKNINLGQEWKSINFSMVWPVYKNSEVLKN